MSPIKVKPRKDPRPPKPTTTTTTTPAPTSLGPILSNLTGNVRTIRANGSAPYGVPWSNIVRYADFFDDAADEMAARFKLAMSAYSLELLMAAMGIVESDGNQTVNGRVVSRDDGFGDGPSVGILQVKPRIWQSLVKDADPNDAQGNIRLGTAIMAQAIAKYGTWQKALTTVYFPTKDPNGTSQNAYVKTVTSLMAEMQNNAGALQPSQPATTTPAPQKPKPVVDPYQVIFNGRQGPVSYGWRADAGLNYYSYGVGHGTTAATQHTGDDVPVPDETPLYAPFDAEVTCVGAEGRVVWGQGCGYYNDYSDNTTGHDRSIGNITLLGEGKAKGYKLVLGHCSDAVVEVGQHVKAGQLVGYSGSMNGPHTHVEMAVEKNGSYWMLDPRPALIEAMGGEAPTIEAERIPYDWDNDPNLFTVKALKDLKVYQRADPSSPVLDTIPKGDTFTAVAVVPGNDGNPYYLGVQNGRVPVEGTEGPVKAA